MRTDFSLERVCGTTYRGGNILFCDNGNSLLVPTGNQLSEHQLVTGSCRTYTSCALNDIACFDITSDGGLLLLVDSKGFGYFINRTVDAALERVPLLRSTYSVKFSHDGAYVAIGASGEVQIWTTPADRIVRYRSVRMVARYHHIFHGDITTMEWAHDDSHLLVCGTDATVRILPRRRVWEARTKMHLFATLVAQKTPVIASFFVSESNDVVVGISVDRCVVTWKQNQAIRRHELIAEKWRLVHQEVSDEEEEDAEEDRVRSIGTHQNKRLRSTGGKDASESDPREDDETSIYETLIGNQTDVEWEMLRLSAYHWEVERKEYLTSSSRVTSVAYSQHKKVLVCGMVDGSFILSVVEPTLTMIHSLSVTAQQVTSVALSPSGDWVAFGSAKLHQLMVWEWSTESYILRHQAHASDINSVCYTSNGLHLVSVGEDGKMKVWRSSTGQCVATFKDHEGAIVGCVPNSANAVYTASADGTVRGYDLQTMKLFRVMRPVERVQLSCIALDPSGDLLAVGTLTSGRIYLFSTQTGKLVEEFTGHTTCVSSLDFHPLGTYLASVSWDETCRVYDIFGADDSTGKKLRGSAESIAIGSMGLCTRFSPDGTLLAVLTYQAEVTLYDVTRGDLTVKTSWNVERDSRGGYNALSGINPQTRNSKRPFTSLAFSPNGKTLVLVGDSKWICMYNVHGGFLLRKWSLSSNRAMEGNVEAYNWRDAHPDAGSLCMIDDAESDEEDRFRKLIKLPGSVKGEHAVGKRSKVLVARAKCVAFTGNGREWVVATTVGLCIYSLDGGAARHSLTFLPHHLTGNMTPAQVRTQLDKGAFHSALMLALALGVPALIDTVLQEIPSSLCLDLVSRIPTPLLCSLMEAVARALQKGKCWELSSIWCKAVLLAHGRYLKSVMQQRSGKDSTVAATLHLLLQAQSSHTEIIKRMSDNRYTLDYWSALCTRGNVGHQ